MPSVSIIIPLHNRAAELPQTLESIRAQTSGDWEAIIVDDHSTDGAKEVAESYALRDGRFKVIDLPDPKRGAPAGRNLGVFESRGEYMIFLDSDDLLSPTCIERRVAHMRSHPEIDFAVWRCQLFREQLGDVPQLWNADRDVDDLERFLKNDMPWGTMGPIWRREALSKLRINVGARLASPGEHQSTHAVDASVAPTNEPQIWDESVLSGQDWEFHIRAVASGLKYARADEIDCHWRLAGPTRDSIGKSSFGRDHALDRLKTLDHLHRFLRETSSGAISAMVRNKDSTRLTRHYVGAIDTVANRVSRRQAQKEWSSRRKQFELTSSQFRQFSRYLFWKRSPAKARRLWNQIKLTWPRQLLPTRGKYFNTAPVDPSRPPRVSVVMSAYNNADYIESAVTSILWQSFRDFEFIIIDDGSTDGTGGLLEQLADTDCRIRLIRRENKGLTVSLNEGLELARGQYVARMDSDDLAIRERFEKQVAYLDANPGCVLVGTKVMLIDPLDVEIVEGEFHQGHDDIDAALLKGNGAAIYHPSVMMRKAALDRVDGYVPKWNGAEDVELFLRLAEIGQLENLEEVLLNYRRHPASVNHTKHEKQFALMIELLNEARARRELPPIEADEVRRWTPEPIPVQLRNWGWNAMKKNRIDVARSHALGAVRGAPFSVENWRLLYSAMRGK
jgi:glycosyltransferase involved in cell wall biosynthesis